MFGNNFLFLFQNFLVYMFFLLVVLLLNYSDSAKDTHSLRLRTQLQQALHTPEYHNISRYTHCLIIFKKEKKKNNMSHILMKYCCDVLLSFFIQTKINKTEVEKNSLQLIMSRV